MGEAGIFVEFLFFVIVWASRRFRPDYTERIVSIKFNLTMAHITFNAAASIKGWGAAMENYILRGRQIVRSFRRTWFDKLTTNGYC